MSEADQEAFLDAERAVIGSILIDGRCFPDVATRCGREILLWRSTGDFSGSCPAGCSGKPVDPVPMARRCGGRRTGSSCKAIWLS